METFLEKEIILITNDISMQLNAEIHGIHTQRYRNSEIKTEDIYLGRAEYGVNDSVINQLYEENMDKQDIIFYDMRTGSECKPDIKENEYLNLQGSSKSILAVYRDGKISKINTDYTKVISQLKNSGQRFAMEALLAPAEKIPLVILKGRAGTAKTFLSVAAGLHQTIQENYNKMIVTRNSVFFDNDIGYLPGSEEEKMSPLLRPVFDNLEEVMRIRGTEDKDLRMTIEDLLDSEIIKVESLAYMRGRSLGHTYLFVDEAQNATPNQIKGIITRAGIGTKIVLSGDPEQIDNPSLSLYNNGLSYASAKFAGSKLCAQITFLDKECVRSDLAMAGAELL